MEETRLRVLTHSSHCGVGVVRPVEMEETRLRVLTHIPLHVPLHISLRRNGRNPIKGIDTPFLMLSLLPYFQRRNGRNPIKGIDTFNYHHFYLVLLQ